MANLSRHGNFSNLFYVSMASMGIYMPTQNRMIIIIAVSVAGLISMCCVSGAILALIGHTLDKNNDNQETSQTTVKNQPNQEQSAEPDEVPKKDVIAIAGAEVDKKKWEAAYSWGTSQKVSTFKKLVNKYGDMPDKLATYDESQKYRVELRKLQDEFSKIPFNGSYQTNEAKKIIDLWQEKMEGKYDGQLYNLLDEEVRNIIEQYKNRVN